MNQNDNYAIVQMSGIKQKIGKKCFQKQEQILMEHHISEGGILKQNTEVYYKIVNSSYDREATGIKSQYHGCLNKS